MEDEVLEPTEEPEETTEPAEPEVDIEQLQATNKKLYERAKKAEAEARALRDKDETPAAPLNVEEAVLMANGMSDELIEKLKAVAAVQKVSLIKAQNDPIFVAVKEKFEKDQKREEASLPASRGAAAIKPKKDFMTPGLSRDEHKKMALEIG